MRADQQADVVVITDGEDDLEPETIDAAVALTKTEGVSWFVVAVGSRGGFSCAHSLGPIATSLVAVTRADETDPVADVINLERGAMSGREVVLKVLRHPATRAVLLALLRELARIAKRRIEERVR